MSWTFTRKHWFIAAALTALGFASACSTTPAADSATDGHGEKATAGDDDDRAGTEDEDDAETSSTAPAGNASRDAGMPLDAATVDVRQIDSGHMTDAGHPIDASHPVDAGHPIDANGHPTDATVPTCTGNHMICGGSCVSIETADHCGGCNACPADPANGYYACDFGNCALICDFGTHEELGACVPDSVNVCKPGGSSCSTDSQCCEDICFAGVCICMMPGQSCTSDTQCCCTLCSADGFCRKQPNYKPGKSSLDCH